MNQPALALLTTFLFCPLVNAQTKPDPAKAALIDEMLAVTKPEASIPQMMAQFKTIFTQNFEKSFNDQVTQNHEDPAKFQKPLHDFEDKVFNLMSDRMSWPRLKPKFIDLYDQTFTKEELADIITFYKTPSGQSLLQKMPTLMTKAMQIGQSEMAGTAPEIEAMASQLMKDLANSKQLGPK